MAIDVIHVLDPEIVNPSVIGAADLEFWKRMLAWSTVAEMRLGPRTLSALGVLASKPPEVLGLSKPEFWAIVGRYSSRAIVPSVGRAVCEGHVREQYSPSLGSSENVDILIADLKALNSGGAVALGTDSACWSGAEVIACNLCRESSLVLSNGPHESAYEESLARAWRQAYLREALGDGVQMRDAASKMFPRILFSGTAWNYLDSLSGSPETTLATVVKHLGVLNDHCPDIWGGCLTTGGREAQLAAHGVTASQEGPRVHKNKKVMRKRDFEFAGRTVRCEWHTKLKPNTDRIYFAVVEGEVLVGAIIDHLPT